MNPATSRTSPSAVWYACRMIASLSYVISLPYARDLQYKSNNCLILSKSTLSDKQTIDLLGSGSGPSRQCALQTDAVGEWVVVCDAVAATAYDLVLVPG